MRDGAARVRVLDNLSNGFHYNIDLFRNDTRYEFIEGDINDFATCSKACEGMDLLCHQAAVGSVPRSVKNPMNTNNSNVGGFVNMAFAAREAGIKRVVYASSSSVYGNDSTLPKVEDKVGDPLSPYAVSKKANELYAEVFGKLYDMEFIGLRYFNVFGPRQDPDGPYAAVIPLFVKALMKGESPFIDGDGEQTRDFTYVDNAVQANMLALTTDNPAAYNQVYNVAFGENYSVNYLFKAIQTQLDSKVEPVYRGPRPGDIRNSLADISKARRLLGYNPMYKFSDGLPKTIAWFSQLFLKEANGG